MSNKQRDDIRAGQAAYENWRTRLRADPEYESIYKEETAKSDLWLQLIEARQSLGLTQAELAKRLGVSQAQVARIEKQGYESHSLNTLRRYVEALGDEFELSVSVRRREMPSGSKPRKTKTPATQLHPELP